MIKFKNKLRSHLYKNDETHKIGGPEPPALHEMAEIRKIGEIALPSPFPPSNDKFCQFHEEITAVTFAFNGMMQFMKSKTRVTIPQVRIKKNMILMNLLSIHTLSQPLTK